MKRRGTESNGGGDRNKEGGMKASEGGRERGWRGKKAEATRESGMDEEKRNRQQGRKRYE